jgi:serine protease inhibitor
MYFILPNAGVSLDRVISDPLTSALLRGDMERTYPQVEMSVPKFDVKSDTDLRTAMTAMGMGGLFLAEEADFSPLTEAESIFLSQAEHAAGVTVDEEGVTGAAYTVFSLAKGAAPPSEIVLFVLDRPFMFAVTAPDSSVLFAGTITDF